MKYLAPRWLPGGHAQTMWPISIKGEVPSYRRERWETPDDDFIDLDWIDAADDAPTVVHFHGLEGSSHSHYARRLMIAVRARGWRGVVVHFRGCSGEPNRLARAYHSGDSAEIDWILRRIAARHPAPRLVVGVSLGGNVLLKWLAEQGEGAAAVIDNAAAICAPLDLAAASRTLGLGINRVYTEYFLRTLVPRALEKARRFPGALDPAAVRRVRSLWQYDDAVTAPLHGFRDAADYYARSSAGPLLGDIRMPVLVLNAANDPFLPAHFLPSPGDVSPAVCLDIQRHGGHVGFVSGKPPGSLDWLPQRVLAWFDDHQPGTGAAG